MGRRVTLRSGRAPATVLALLTASALALSGCGDSTPSSLRRSSDGKPITAAQSACETATMDADLQVARRLYREVDGGRIGIYASDRLLASSAFVTAVRNGDGAAVRRIVTRLNDHQIVAVEVTHGSHVLLSEDAATTAMAPMRSKIVSAGTSIGELVVAVEGDGSYSGTVQALAGPITIVSAGSRRLAGPAGVNLSSGGPIKYRGASYREASFTGQAFPSGSLKVSMLVPEASLSVCMRGGGLTPSQATANAFEGVAKNIYHNEQTSATTRAIVHDFEKSKEFQQAVATDNATATRAVIIKYFRTHLHVVRVRAYRGNQLVLDLGGPHVLAPARGVLREADGHVFGHFLLSVQDDEGFKILTSTFTGAQVLMRMGSDQVMSTLPPSSSKLRIPQRGVVSFQGVRYQAVSFTTRAFPSGPLRISLLVSPSPRHQVPIIK